MAAHKNYNHKGINYALSDDLIQDSKACYGIDMPHVTNKAIDWMPLPDVRAGKNSIEIKIIVPVCNANECVFQIRFVKS